MSDGKVIYENRHVTHMTVERPGWIVCGLKAS